MSDLLATAAERAAVAKARADAVAAERRASMSADEYAEFESRVRASYVYAMHEMTCSGYLNHDLSSHYLEPQVNPHTWASHSVPVYGSDECSAECSSRTGSLVVNGSDVLA